MKWGILVGIALWAIIPCVIANKKNRSGIAYFFLSFLITPLITTIITLCLNPLDEHNVATDFLPEHECGGFTSKAESEFIHNAIANGSTFNDARAEYKRLNEVRQLSELQENVQAVEPAGKRFLHEPNMAFSEEEADNNIFFNDLSKEQEKNQHLTGSTALSLDDKQATDNTCSSCGCSIPADSKYCQYCGTIVALKQDSEVKAIPIAVSTNNPHLDISVEKMAEKTDVILTDEPVKKEEQSDVFSKEDKARFCKKCGGTIDKDTRKCSSCGKQYFRPKSAIPILILSVMVLAFAGLNVWQYFLCRQANDTIDNLNNRITTLNNKVASLNSDITKKNTEISDLDNQISVKDVVIRDLNKKIENLRVSAEEYEAICDELSYGNIGYGAYNFNVNQSVIILKRTDTSKKIILTANWANGGEVSIDYSNYNAWFEFDNNSWSYSTTLSVVPVLTGATIATFRNNIDSNSFKVLIIITD